MFALFSRFPFPQANLLLEFWREIYRRKSLTTKRSLIKKITMSNHFAHVNFKALCKNGQSTACLIKFNGRQNLIPFLSSDSSIKSSNNYSTCLKKENYHTLNKVMKNLFAIKNYSTSLLSENNTSTTLDTITHNTSSEQKTTELDVTNYDNWTRKQVCSLLCLPKSNGGAGLTIEDVKPLYDAGFKGTSLGNIVNDIQKKDKDPVDECLKDFPTVPRGVIRTVVFWVDNLLKTKLYHLWSAVEVKQKLHNIAG